MSKRSVLLEAALKAVTLLVQQKVCLSFPQTLILIHTEHYYQILQNGKDDIGLVLFGTEGTQFLKRFYCWDFFYLCSQFFCLLVTETNNDLAEDGYNNISVLREITTPDLELLKIIENIRPGGHNADCTSTL